MIPLLNRSGDKLYEQIYSFYRNVILSGRLKSGYKIPSHRTLAAELQVSKNTVLKAYDQLTIEGYLTNETRKGLYVSKLENETKHSPAVLSPERKKFKKRSARHVVLTDNLVDEQNFPIREWRKCSNWALDNITFQYQESEATDPLKTELIAYLYSSRGVVAKPEQMVIGSGASSLFFWLAFVLRKKHSTMLFENPGYPTARNLFVEYGFQIKPIPVNESGLSISHLLKEKKSILYLTPSHQYPTGATIPVGHRLQILRWAERNDALIIEDDFDCEFRYKTRLIPSFQALDHVNRVIYVGSFSNSIMPSLRVAYLVLPEKLAEEYRSFMHLNSVTFITRKILATFMERGYWERHLKKMRKIYGEKYLASVSALKSLPKEHIRFSEHASGLNILLRVNTALKEETLIRRAMEKEIVITPASSFYYKGKGLPSFPEVLFEFGNIELTKIPEVVRKLHDVWFYGK